MDYELLEVPMYFTCPISLQIMRDPVTAITGITYERESIESWLRVENDDKVTTCPVTNQLLPRDSDLTPNHTLRRLIQAWCITKGVDRIPTPKPLLDPRHVLKLVRDLRQDGVATLKKMEALVTDSDRNRKCMAEAGVFKAMTLFVTKCSEDGTISGVEEALRIFRHIWEVSDGNKRVSVDESGEFLDSLSWILGLKEVEKCLGVKSEALRVLNLVIRAADSRKLERLRLELFANVTSALREMRENHSPFLSQSVKAALGTLIEAYPWGRNRQKIVEAGAVFEIVELELGSPDRRVTELGFSLLAGLCSCAEGRARLVGHAGGIAVVTKRVLRVSAATDEHAMQVLSVVARYSAKGEVLAEMLAVGAVAKLCMVMQADCDTHLKEKARGILKLHSKVWSDSPCVDHYLLSRHPR